MSDKLEPGWLEKQFTETAAEVAGWPPWMRGKLEGTPMSDVWTVRMLEGGGYTVHDEAGQPVGSYTDPEVAIAHHVNAMRDRRRMTKALVACLTLIEKGFEVRLQGQWPALEGPMLECKKQIREILFPEMQRIEIKSNSTVPQTLGEEKQQ